MAVSIQAVYKNGVFAPVRRSKLKLHEGQKVELVIAKSDAEQDSAFALAELAVETGIPDLAREHDHYLYGTPKREKRNARKTKLR
ncbi:antitoxin family protein [candidate division KSB1 bacterium]|nr:antitoxin family protein [candidate division KSB1 bacterium]